MLTALCGVLIAVTKIRDGAPAGAVLLLVLFLVLGFVLSPLAFPRSTPRGAAPPAGAGTASAGVSASPPVSASPGGSASPAGSASPGGSALPGSDSPSGSASTVERPVVYWRPGCVFCLRLRVRLGSEASRLDWIDIWQDPAAAAAVREITGGDETVPTVVINGQGHVNPDPSWLRDQIVPAAQR